MKNKLLLITLTILGLQSMNAQKLIEYTKVLHLTKDSLKIAWKENFMPKTNS